MSLHTLTMPQEFWLVVVGYKLNGKHSQYETVCFSKSEVESELRNVEADDSYRVWRSGDGELGRDVTEDFPLPEQSDDDAWGRDYVSNGRSQSPLNYNARRDAL